MTISIVAIFALVCGGLWKFRGDSALAISAGIILGVVGAHTVIGDVAWSVVNYIESAWTSLPKGSN